VELGSEESNLTFQQKLELAKQIETPQKGTPKVESIHSVLSQALHTNDKKSISECMLHASETAINKTVKKLPTSDLIPLLKYLLERLQKEPSLIEVSWLHSVLTIHTSYLMTIPDLVKLLSVLYLTADTRVSMFQKFQSLYGRLDLLISSKSSEQFSETAFITYLEP